MATPYNTLLPLPVNFLSFILFSLLSFQICLGSSNSSVEEDEGECEPAGACNGGVIIPVWNPVHGISTATVILRATVYFLGLCYMFLGVSKIAYLFMEAIEVITSTTTVRIVRTESGEEREIEVQVWNETVANLTLMALGSSAPEILLSVIEIVGNKFEAGDLGPGTIVGSAAFNLFVITAICVYVIPDGTGKSVKNFGVFTCTAIWSVGAYVWLYLMIAVVTPERVDWWEGLITLLMFVVLIAMSYVIDRKNDSCAVGFRYIGIYDPEDNSTEKVKEQSEKIPLNDVENGNVADNPRSKSQASSQLTKIIEQKQSTKEKIMARLKQVADERPDDPDSWVSTVEKEIATLIYVGRSRAYFRIHKTDVSRQVKLYKKFLEESGKQLKQIKQDSATRNVVFCADSKVKFAESCEVGKINIERVGPFINNTVTKVHYAVVESEKATHAATAGKDFKTVEGWLDFGPGDTLKTIEVVIYDDPEFEEDEEFIVKLFDIQESHTDTPTSSYVAPKLQRPEIVCVIVDDDHHGRFAFSETTHTASIPTSSTLAADRIHRVDVDRTKGCRGLVRIPYEIVPIGACQGGKHFTIAGKPEIIFEDKQYKAVVEIEVLPIEDMPAEGFSFKLVLGQPEVLEKASDVPEAKPEVMESEKEATIKLIPSMKSGDLEAMKEGPETSWSNKIKDSFKLPEEGVFDYIMFFLQMPFTVVFCLVPPPGLLGGWAAFVVAITFIGGITAFIGDLAGAFGCTVGLKDAVTAITLVALGTSLPDTFASKVAATNDKYADSSVGNVTGSNAVNVFLGVGVAWFVAAIYHLIKGSPNGFVVKEGSLGLSVSLFVILACVCILTLMARRVFLGCELGGPKIPKVCTSLFFVSLWILYLVISVLNAYCVIESPL